MLKSFVLAATLVAGKTLASHPDITAYAACIAQAVGGNATLYTFPTDPEFATELDPYNLDHIYYPSAIAFPTCTPQVAALVKCAQAAGIAVQALSGGHGFDNFALGGQNGSLSIRLKYLDAISYNEDDETITFGTGNLLGSLTEHLNSVNRAAAYSSIGSIGTGGHITIGGLGPRSRSLGLASDQIVAAKVVLADGSVVKASESENEDLFFAIRGAGWSFGIVTEFTLATQPIVQAIEGSYIIPGNSTTLGDVYGAWQALISKEDLPEEFATTMYAYDGFLLLVTSFYGTSDEYEAVGLDAIFVDEAIPIPTSEVLAVLDKLNLTALVDLVEEFESTGLLSLLPSLPESMVLELVAGLQQLAPVIETGDLKAINKAITESKNDVLIALVQVLNATSAEAVFTDIRYSGLLEILTNETDFSLLGAILPNLNLTEVLELVGDLGKSGLISMLPEGTKISTLISFLFGSHTPAHFYAKSLKFTPDTLLSSDAIADVFTYIKETDKDSPLWFVVFDLAGGAINAPAQDATAYWHRDALYWLQSYIVNLNGPVSAASKSFLTGLNSLVQQGTPGIDDSAYAGYVDEALEDPQTAYWGGNVEKLQEIKGQYDPENVFRNPQSIEVA